MASDPLQELFSSLVSDIKNYNGDDPLRPWLQGIRKMKACLPPAVLKEKLPRFLQKCAQTFESDRRYRNDARYLRVWIELMDYVNDAKAILRKMEKNRIGVRRAMFYIAYAMYYEKRKKFEEAEKMYHVGVQNLAEPVSELRKSYEQFLQRMALYKTRKAKLQERLSNAPKSGSRIIPLQHAEAKIIKERTREGGVAQKFQGNASVVQCYKDTGNNNSAEECLDFANEGGGSKICKDVSRQVPKCEAHFSSTIQSDDPRYKNLLEQERDADMNGYTQTQSCPDDTVVVKFVGSAIFGKSETENACHHGLVDPTINMKDAMNAIISMFREPLEAEPFVKRRTHQTKSNKEPETNGFEIFVDESFEEGTKIFNNNKLNTNGQNGIHSKPVKLKSSMNQLETKPQKPFIGMFEILADDDEDSECNEAENIEIGNGMEVPKQPAYPTNASVCSEVCDLTYNSNNDLSILRSGNVRLKEDTIIQRFVGSTVLDESKVENACHHGLVDPTINLKEAMDDINSMFGRPLNFAKAKKPYKQREILKKASSSGFSILEDDHREKGSRVESSSNISQKLDREGELFEPTVFTKEAIDEINEMFGRPLDF